MAACFGECSDLEGIAEIAVGDRDQDGVPHTLGHLELLCKVQSSTRKVLLLEVAVPKLLDREHRILDE